MSRLKKKCGSHKLSKDVATNYKCGNSEEYVLISFAFVTENKKYNFDYFRDSMHREEIAARRSLDRLLNELSINTWLALGQRSKYQIGGFEKIPCDSCNNSIFNKFPVSPDSNIHSFRFGDGDSYRMIGIKPTNCHRINILGYDFDHSAYNHG